MSEQVMNFIPGGPDARVAKDKVVRLRYVLFDRDADQPVDAQDGLCYLHGGHGAIFPKVEEALDGRFAEEKVDLSLEPEEAFGPRDEALVMTVPVARLPEGARQPGAWIEGETTDGRTAAMQVTAVGETEATLDGNHPLAGKKLQMFIKILEVRDASEEELANGEANQPEPETEH